LAIDGVCSQNIEYEQNPLNQKVVTFRKGEYLFRQNEDTHDLFIIRKGRVRIFKTEGTIEVELDTVGPGIVVGEIASIDGGQRTASGVAVDDTETVCIPGDEFQSILAKIPDWFRKIAMILVQRLREVDSKINLTLDGDHIAHVAALISLISHSDIAVRSIDGIEIDLKYLENELIDLLGIQPAEIVESIEWLAKKHLLKVERNKVKMVNQIELNKIAEPIFCTGNPIPIT